MTLNETHIRELLDQSTPGPWNVAMLDLHRDTGVIDNEHAQANQKLAALAPELAQDWIRMRNDLGHLARILEEFAASPDAVPAVPVETFAAHLIHQILNWELSNDHYRSAYLADQGGGYGRNPRTTTQAEPVWQVGNTLKTRARDYLQHQCNRKWACSLCPSQENEYGWQRSAMGRHR